MDRRSFLQRAGFLGAGLALPSSALGAPFGESEVIHRGVPPMPLGWTFVPLKPRDAPNFGDLVLMDRSHYGQAWQPMLWDGTRWVALDS